MPEPELEKYLRIYYLRGPQYEKNEWPPSFNVKYIHLVMIQRSAMPWHKSKAKSNIGLVAKGQMERIQGKRLHLRDIMAFSGRVCVINGAPGVGKTTLALKLRRDWANRELLNNFHLVLSIPLREPIAKLSETVDELFDYFGKNCNEGDKELIKREHGKGVLFILDGWDELRLSCRGENQFFPKLVSGTILPGCSIIVTSRPGASRDIHCFADQIVEILGFGKKQVDDYIEAYFSKDVCGDSEGASMLTNDLQKYPNVASTCYVAINLAIICYVYHALGFRLPQTLTEIYKWFIIHTVLRYLQKKKVAEAIAEELPAVESTEDVFDSSKFDLAVQNIFKESVMDVLKNLGNLALNGLKNDDLCFSRKDLVRTCDLDADDHQFDGFGLLKPVQISHIAGSEPYYHFLHLEEFVAAFHISQVEASEQMRWLVHDSKYDATIKFFCGVDQFKSRPLRIFFTNAEPLRLFHLECIYEGQWKDHCKVIAKRYSSSFALNQYSTLQPQQWTVLGYVMSNSETQWHFTCKNQFLEEKNLACFVEHLSNKALYHLTLEEVHASHDVTIHLSEICRLQEKLTELDIINCGLDLSAFLKAMESHRSLEKICIRDETATSLLVDAFRKLLPTLLMLKDIELVIQNFSHRDYLDIKQFASRINPSPNFIVPEKLCVNTKHEGYQLKGELWLLVIIEYQYFATILVALGVQMCPSQSVKSESLGDQDTVKDLNEDGNFC